MSCRPDLRRSRFTALGLALAVVVPAAGSVFHASRALADGAIAATEPTSQPTTQPGTQPSAAVKVSDDTRRLLDQVRDAYRAATTLHLSGSIHAEKDINGMKGSNSALFDASWQAADAGVGKLRHSVKDTSIDAKEEKEDTILGSTGDKLYVFNVGRKLYQEMDAPKARPAAGKFPSPFGELLTLQNPSLLLAVTDDAAAELLDGTIAAEIAPDVTIDGVACPVLKLTAKEGDTFEGAFDPKTHLLRRVTFDSRTAADRAGKTEVLKDEVVIDYRESGPAADLKKEQFAWAPPRGARDAAAMAAGAEAGGEAAPASALEGKAAPGFTLKGMDGADVSLSDQKGKVVVLDFWATWCGPCRESLPHLNKLYESKKDKAFIAFALDLKEEKDEVAAGIKQLKLTLPVLLDAQGSVAQKYLVSGIPQTVVINKDGTVRKVFVGSGNDEAIQAAVAEAMK